MSASDTRSWVERTISSLDGGFDKKKLLEEAESLGDPEIRSLIATSITASMVKRKLEQYLERGDPPGSEPRGSPDVETHAVQVPDSSDDVTESPPESPPSTSPEAEPDPQSVSPPREEPSAQEPQPAPMGSSQPVEMRENPPSQDPVPPKPSSSERFSRLEKTVLASKSSDDLSIPSIPEGMVDTIRQLKDLAHRKAEQTEPKSFTPKKRPIRSGELIDALGGTPQQPPQTPSVEAPVQDAPAQDSVDSFAEASLSAPSESAPEQGPLPSSPQQATDTGFDADDALEEFEAFLNEPAKGEKSGSEVFHEEAGPVPSTEVDATDGAGDAKAGDDITARFDDLLATMSDINTDLPHSPEKTDPPRIPEETQPQTGSPPGVVRRVPEPPHAPSAQYDGSWIERCENITDIIEMLRVVDGSITDVRTTVALYVLGFSEELAATIRTAQNRDELELMLRKALTATIDDAFDKTMERFSRERSVLEREAEVAAVAFDDAVRAEEEHRLEVERAAVVRAEDAAIDETASRLARERSVLEREAEVAARAFDEAVRAEEEHRLQLEHAAEHTQPERVTVRSTPQDRPAASGRDVLATAKAVHAHAERESAAEPIIPKPMPAPSTRPTLAERIAKHIESLHDLIESGDYDDALERLEKARELLGRQITLKEHRKESVVDERMADFELKGLALDLEILKARQ